MDFLVSLFNTIFTYPILNGLMALYAWSGDFGLAIVILTCVISLLLLPLTLRQIRLAKAMKKLQPQLKAISQQHPTDPLAQNRAKQELYKEHGLRPGRSFLSMLIQVPIYSGLYVALNTILQATSVGEINSHLYPFLLQLTALPNINLTWLTVLNATWHISLALPDPTHLLPLLAGVATFLQMRMTQSLSLVDARETFNNISQSLQWLMLLIPVAITIAIAWQFAAGLALYRFVSLLMNILQRTATNVWETFRPVSLAGYPSGNPPPAPQLQMPSTAPGKKRQRTMRISKRNSRRTRKRR